MHQDAVQVGSSRVHRDFAWCRFVSFALLGLALPLSAQSGDKNAKQGRTGSFDVEEAGAPTRSRAAPSKKSNSPSKAGAAKAATALQARTLYRTKVAIELRSVPAQSGGFAVAKLPAGSYVVGNGDTIYGHTPVGVIGGFEGYIYGELFSASEDGKGTVTKGRVSFRGRPKTGEPPLDIMKAKGKELLVLGREGAWYKVLSDNSISAWAEAKQLSQVGKFTTIDNVNDAAIKAAMIAQRDARRGAWTQQREAFAKGASRRKELAGLAQAVVDANQVLTTELSKAKQTPLQADLSACEAIAKKLEASVVELKAKDEAVAKSVADFRQRLRREGLMIEALQEIARSKIAEAEKAKAKVVEAATPKPTPEFAQVGWLEYNPGLKDYSPYRIVKGRRLICYVTCKSGRYDLKDFVGRELGLRGSVDRPETADVRVLDVARLVVLSGAR